jgi:hypothetical protein
MQRLNLILLPSALALALPGWADASPKNPPLGQPRPLNLSLPQDLLAPPSDSSLADETVQRNLHPPAQSGNGPEAPARPASLPYGAGYEHRHQENWGATGGAGAGAGTGAGAGSGAGRGRR